MSAHCHRAPTGTPLRPMRSTFPAARLDEELAMGMTSTRTGAAAASVLASTQVTCILPAKDMARARRSNEEALGLVPLGAKPDGKFVYHCGGTELALLPKPEVTKADVISQQHQPRVQRLAGGVVQLATGFDQRLV
jgi:hypothetical protein